jgi:site-specific recombinase XerD
MTAPEFRKQISTRMEAKIPLLPLYIQDYLLHKKRKRSPNTLLNYCHDFLEFYSWLIQESYFQGEIKDLPLEVLNKLRRTDMDLYVDFLTDGQLNKKRTVQRKLASLSSLFHFLHNEEDENFNTYLTRNVMSNFEIGSVRETPSARAQRIKNKILRGDDIPAFREFVAYGYGEMLKQLIEEQKASSNEKELRSLNLTYKAFLRNRERDTAIISLILGSGLRISEVAGLDVDSINWRDVELSVIRKGSKEDSVPFSDIAKADLEEYLKIREEKYQVSPKEKALFLSSPTGPNAKCARMTVRSMQTMVKKYAQGFGIGELSVHKLRHSYATNHYMENEDIIKLQSLLGHSDVNTTSLYTHLTNNELRDSVNKADR